VIHDPRTKVDVSRGRSSTDLLNNRRQTERYAVAQDQAWIGWWEGRLYRKSPAVLIDISSGGAKLIAKYPPPRRSTIWICVAGQHQTEWVEGTSLDVLHAQDGSAEVRVSFRDVCPYAFFEVVVYGVGNGTEEFKAAHSTDSAGRAWW
jgi:hypothetical protein